MLDSHVKFHSSDGKRQILIADDELINREILGAILQDKYNIVFACDGLEALEIIREKKETLSLALLDILMPGMTGIEVLKAAKEDPSTAHVPVIVVTSEQKAEVESLTIGAADFIPKPYPDVGVIRARVMRVIELSEDRQIIQSTERDTLTGLYNRDYFYRYAEQYDQFHKDKEMDAILIDINHFHLINERYGKEFGDEVLRKIAQNILAAISHTGAIVGHGKADTFMVYCPHCENCEELLETISENLTGEESASYRVRLRMGVYSNTDKSIDIERRFDRAKMASDAVRGSFTKTVGYYDIELHEKEIYAEQLIEEFPTAIEEGQFAVYYQPKFDIRLETPLLAGAEALVRWVHPKFGMISPGVFVPLFEENGLIQKLDNYVWEKTAKQIQDWKKNFGYAVPVSVNVSRVDMLDLDFTESLLAILKKYNLTSADFRLEVTESAYTSEAEQIVRTVESLREHGFQIEMDDFGTGYSSLNMISTLPIDALKLDMQFIRNAFKEGGNTHLIEIIINIADFLAVPVIAEGVETEEQLDALRMLGCDLVQGYFFSKPVPALEFEAFILQKKESEKAGEEKAKARSEAYSRNKEKAELPLRTEAEKAEQDTERTDTADAVSLRQDGRTGIQLRTANLFFALLALFAAIALFVSDISVARGYHRMEEASDRYISAQLATSDMESGSDYLTDRVRCFVVTGDMEYLRNFIEEVEVTKRRDHAVENLEMLLEGKDSKALSSLNTALNLSNELVSTEFRAIRLTLEAGSYDMTEVPAAITEIELSPEELAMSREALLKEAQTLVFDNNYMHYKDRIREYVSQCTQALIRTSSQELENASSQMALLVRIQTGLTILFLLIVLAIVVFIGEQIRKPLTKMVKLMQTQEMIPPMGAEELRFVTSTYNAVLEENREARERLSHQASHDALTGLFNRGAYDMLMESVDREHMALILVDVDYFKSINDTYGHAIGDKVLRKVAEILQKSFRSVDIICRIGGDEFVVVMTRANSTMRQLVLNKIARANELLQHPKDGLPPVSLSVGVAFSDRENPKGDIFTDADEALYRVKEAGRNGCAIF